MIKSAITFYAVGLNGNNWAYDKDALESILAGAGLSPVLALSRVLSFGTSFEITAEQYAVYKTATYLKIVNTDTDSGATITRYGFIQNFLALYTGGYEVAYSLDDWANYVLNADEFNAHMDGFVTHANLTLATRSSGNNFYNLNKSYGEFKDTLTVTEQNTAEMTGASLTYGRTLAPGFMCALIKYKEPLYLGKQYPKSYSRTLIYDKEKRINVLGYYGITIVHYNETAKEYRPAKIAVENADGTQTQVSEVAKWEPDSDNIEQITYLPFFPVANPTVKRQGDLYIDEILDTQGNINNYKIVYNNQNNLTVDHIKQRELFDVSSGAGTEIGGIFSIDPGRIFSTEITYNITDFTRGLTEKPYLNGNTFIRDFNIDTYYKTSRYKGSSEFMRVTLGYQSAEIEVSPAALKVNTTVTCGISADLASAYIKLNNANETIAPLNTALSENLNLLLPPIGYNRESERNAKLTGYLSGTAGVLTGVGGVIGGVASVNPGLFIGGLQGAIQGGNTFYKTSILKTRTNTPASRDTFSVELLEKNLPYIAVSYPAEYASDVILKQYEYTGIDTLYEINEYLEKEKCRAFNFVQCDQSIELHGIPEEPAQRIAAALIQGITLWTSKDVGNKKQVNYGVEL